MTLRRDLEELVNIGKREREVEILGAKVLLKLLDTGENIECMKACSGLDVFAREKEIKVQTLARATVSINGLPVAVDELMEFFRKLQEPVLNIFIESYMVLRELQVAEISTKQNPQPEKKKKDGK